MCVSDHAPWLSNPGLNRRARRGGATRTVIRIGVAGDPLLSATPTQGGPHLVAHCCIVVAGREAQRDILKNPPLALMPSDSADAIFLDY